MKLFKTVTDMFWKRKKQVNDHWTDKPANVIATAIIKLQQKFATLMNKWFAKMNTKEQRSTLIACSVMSFILCAAIIMESVVNDLNSDPVLEVNHKMNVPTLQKQDTAPVISKQVINSIQKYKAYMDSSKQVIPAALLDSLELLERIYQSQK